MWKKKETIKKEEVPEESADEGDQNDSPVEEEEKVDKPKEEKKKSVKEELATRAKRLSKEGLTTFEVGEALGISKYEASKLIKG